MSDLDDSKLPPRVQFIKREAFKRHPAFALHGEYDVNSDKFMPTDVSIDRTKFQSTIELSDLQSAIKEFRRSCSDDHGLSNIDLENCTWEDLFSELAKVEKNRTEEEKRGIGFLKGIWQKTGRNAEKIEPWLDFIPDDYGLNFVRAGMVIILNFAKLSAVYAERLKQAIIQVVDAVAKCVPKRRVQMRKEYLQSYIHDLYVLVLKAVSHIIKFLLQGIGKPVLKRHITKIFKSSTKDQESKPESPTITLKQIEEIVKDVQDQANQVDELYQYSIHETIVEGFELKLKIYDELRYVREDTYEAKRIGNEILQQTRQNRGGFDQSRRIPKLIRALFQIHDQKLETTLKQVVHTEISNMLNNILRDQEIDIEGGNQRGRLLAASAFGSPRPQTPAPRIEFLLTFPELLSILDVHPDSPIQDLDTVMMAKPWLEGENSTVAERLAQEPRFCNWLAAQGSGFLLVEGNDDEHATDAMSYMSFVCLAIIGKLTSLHRPREVVIYFFCGLHCEQHEGPNFMIRSLVMQVLLTLEARECLDLSFISNEYFIRGLQSHKPANLLSALAALLRQFPVNTTIYCILDGINNFEGGYPYSFKQSMVELIRELRDLTLSHLDMHRYDLIRDRQYSSHQCNLKLLLTSANTTDTCWESVVHPGNRVSTGYMY